MTHAERASQVPSQITKVRCTKCSCCQPHFFPSPCKRSDRSSSSSSQLTEATSPQRVMCFSSCPMVKVATTVREWPAWLHLSRPNRQGCHVPPHESSRHHEVTTKLKLWAPKPQRPVKPEDPKKTMLRRPRERAPPSFPCWADPRASGPLGL